MAIFVDIFMAAILLLALVLGVRQGFVQSLPGVDFSKITGCCIGKQTAKEAEKYGIHCRVAEKATMDSFIECIKGAI